MAGALALKMESDCPCLLAKGRMTPYLSILQHVTAGPMCTGGSCDAASVGGREGPPSSLALGWSRCPAGTGLGFT